MTPLPVKAGHVYSGGKRIVFRKRDPYAVMQRRKEADMLKLSYLCTGIYADPALFARPESWPVPRRFNDSKMGLYSIEFAIEQARRAEKFGFDWVSVSEHHYWPIIQVPNAAVLGAALARELKRAKIAWAGPLVAMNNPVRIAEEIAMLDQLSGGRLIVLPLRGTANEFLAYGVRPDESRARTQEAAELIVRALTEPNPFGWEGRFYRHRTVSVWPGATQIPHPPVYWSGNSVESVNFAARHRWGMAMSFYPQHLAAELVQMYQQACAKNGWKPLPDQMLYRCYIAVADSDQEAKELESRYYGTAGAATRRGRAATIQQDKRLPIVTSPREIGTDADKKNTEAAGFALGKLTFCGCPETVVKQIKMFQAATSVGVIDLGFSGGGLTPQEAAKSLRLFGEQVLPHIRGFGAASSLVTREAANVPH